MITLIPVPPAPRISADIPDSYFHDCHLMPLAHGGRSALEIFLATVARSPRWVEALTTRSGRAACGRRCASTARWVASGGKAPPQAIPAGNPRFEAYCHD
jgi:hypothetical protein